jgi:Glycine zipper 2TM domain
MNRNSVRFAAFATMVSTLTLLSAPASAQYGNYYNRNTSADQYYANANYRGEDSQNGYGRDDYYDRDGRCKTGSTGLILGAVAGGLLGRTVVGRYGDKTMGTILGGAAGALAGRALSKSSRRGC